MKSEIRRIALGDDVSRRELLRGAAAGGLALGLGGTLSACGGDGGSAPGPNAATGTGAPGTGGSLRVGLSAGGSGDTLDAHVFVSRADSIRNLQLYDQLSNTDADLQPQFQLAEEITPNASADEWTVRLKRGLEFHNGKSVTADDVMFTIRRVFEKQALGLSKIDAIDPRRMRKLDERTVRFPLTRPYSVLDLGFGDGYILGIVPEGYDPLKPVGTGPFKYERFEPGRQALFPRFENYHGDKALVDQLVFTSLPDESARLNALLSGQVDVITEVPLAQARTVDANKDLRLLDSETGSWLPIYMRVDVKPFDDVRVRQALRLVANREQMVQQALAGYGRTGNDLYAPFDRSYASDIPERTQDIEQARSLLRSAGQEGLSVELNVAPVGTGMTEACQVFAKNAAEAGVDVRLKRIDVPTLYGDNVLQWPFAVDNWPSLSYAMTVVGADGPGASFNETHFDDPEFNRIVREATSTVDADRRVELFKEAQRIQHERGGYIIWGFTNTVDGHSAKVGGFVTPDRTGYGLGGAQLNKVGFV